MSSNKTYTISRDLDGSVHCAVFDAGTGASYPLKHVVYHSPTGFEIGSDGSGPADLALSILTDYFAESGEHISTGRYPSRA